MKERRITAIQGAVQADDWRQAFVDTGQALAVVRNQRVYYPYDWYLLRHRAITWFGATGMDLSCLIDSRTGVAATTDRFQTGTVATADALVLDRRLERDITLRVAKRYAAHATRQRHKALLPPKIELVARRPVYKPFWVVDYRLENRCQQRMLVDGVTGECCTLATDTAADGAQPAQ